MRAGMEGVVRNIRRTFSGRSGNVHFAQHFVFRKISITTIRTLINFMLHSRAIIYLPNRELFAAKKFRSQKFFRNELNSSNECAIKGKKVVAKSSLITIIALPRDE